ncbi:MAG: hypothetical protein HYY36_03435 [Gammaproteobacteria bacterium]|nr:hypothetical protein [Gammaproteobacteria bacterium]
MRYLVEARLVSGKPRLRILDADSGRACLEWSLVKVEQMFDVGQIRREDFLHPERYGMKLLVKNLFLLACIETPPKATPAAESARLAGAEGWGLGYWIAPRVEFSGAPDSGAA